MIRNVAVAALFAAGVLMAPAAVNAGPDECALNCYWDARYEGGQFTHWTWECPGVHMICDAPAEPPPP